MSDCSSQSLEWFQARAIAVVEALRASLELEHVGSVSLEALAKAKAVVSRGGKPARLGELCEIGFSQGGGAATLVPLPGVDSELVARAVRSLGLAARIEEGKVQARLTPAVSRAAAKRSASRRMPCIEALREIRRKAKRAHPSEDWTVGSSSEKAMSAELSKMQKAVESMVERNSRPYR